MFPLLFVLAVTAIKDAYEDYRRYRSDRDLNSRTAYRIDVSSGSPQIQETTWARLVVGDIAVVKRDEFIPADLVILDSSGENGICYISSMNLDGETNLKVRRALLPAPTRTDDHHSTYVVQTGIELSWFKWGVCRMQT